MNDYASRDWNVSLKMFLGAPFFDIFKDSTEMAENYQGFERNPIINWLLEQLTGKIKLKNVTRRFDV